MSNSPVKRIMQKVQQHGIHNIFNGRCYESGQPTGLKSNHKPQDDKNSYLKGPIQGQSIIYGDVSSYKSDMLRLTPKKSIENDMNNEVSPTSSGYSSELVNESDECSGCFSNGSGSILNKSFCYGDSFNITGIVELSNDQIVSQQEINYDHEMNTTLDKIDAILQQAVYRPYHMNETRKKVLNDIGMQIVSEEKRRRQPKRTISVDDTI